MKYRIFKIKEKRSVFKGQKVEKKDLPIYGATGRSILGRFL